MPSTMNPDYLLCGLRFGNKPLRDLHIREDHRQPVPRVQDGHLDPGSTRADASRADGPPHGHDLASAPSRITKEATVRTTRRRRRRPGHHRPARGLRAVRCVSDELLRASGAVIRSARAPQPRAQTPVSPAGQARKAQQRTVADRTDREDCFICRASISF
jgi:hypothetical protein